MKFFIGFFFAHSSELFLKFAAIYLVTPLGVIQQHIKAVLLEKINFITL